VNKLTPHSFDFSPADVEPRPSLDYTAADTYLDANPSRGETAEDIARWEQIKREFIEKWVPLTNMRVRQAK
jgi:hypothetical protein